MQYARRETSCRIISLCNNGGNASVLNRSQKEGRGETSKKGAVLDVDGSSSTSLLGVGSCLCRGSALATGLLDATEAGVLALDLVLVLKSLEGVVASTLDVTSRLEVEGTLDKVEGREFDSGSSC